MRDRSYEHDIDIAENLGFDWIKNLKNGSLGAVFIIFVFFAVVWNVPNLIF